MSSAPIQPDPLQAQPVPADAPPLSYSRGIFRAVFRRSAARIGMSWILCLLFLACFAPLIANSNPLLAKIDDHWSSPAMASLDSSDVILLIAFVASFTLYFLHRRSVQCRVFIFIILIAATSLIAVLFVRPPLLPEGHYGDYRDWRGPGRLQFVLNAPIPFSPGDHLLDRPDLYLTPPRFFSNGPASVHLLGTTSNNADMASNMIYAARIALSIGFISSGIAVVIGIVVGAFMGYFAGAVDLIGMRIIEIFDSIPTLLLLLIFVAAWRPYIEAHSPGVLLYAIMVILGLTGWSGYAYFVRAEFLSLRKKEFVQSAVAAGLPLDSIIFRHILPNAMTPIIVNASFGVAGAILAESTLSFLGIGLTGEASWGVLLQELTSGGSFYWWIALFPGLAIFLTVYAYTLIGESLRDALDPKMVFSK